MVRPIRKKRRARAANDVLIAIVIAVESLKTTKSDAGAEECAAYASLAKKRQDPKRISEQFGEVARKLTFVR